MTPETAAIVVSFHTGPSLRECLYALLGEPGVSEIIVVDNGNPPTTRDWLDRFAEARPCQVIRPSDNLGFGKAVNLGARATSKEALLIINPDAVLRRGSLAALAEAADGARRPWLVGGRLFGVEGGEQAGPRRRRLTLWTALTTFTGLAALPGVPGISLLGAPPPSGPIAMDTVSGALMLIRRDDFLSLGGFDEGYFLHVEDIDLCRRVWDAGGLVLYTPCAGALHYGSTSDAPSVVVERHKAAGLGRYFRKFAKGPAGTLAAWALAPLVTVLLVGRAHLRRLIRR